MGMGGKLVGVIVISVVILAAAFALYTTQRLEEQRVQNIEQLMSLPQYAQCEFEANGDVYCPQAQGAVVIPNVTGVLFIILGILLGAYLIRSDRTNRTILQEIKGTKARLATDERRSLIESILTLDERKIINAVREQPGISQATLRLRTNMSKAKLSVTLKELEGRKLIRKIEDGKTNNVHLAREI